MRVQHDSGGFSANAHGVKSDIERSDPAPSTAARTFGVKYDVAPDWFAEAAQKLYPIKGGTELHYLTDYDERLCQKYVAGTVKPSAYFLRTVLRTPHGGLWLPAVMAGSEAEWWVKLQREAAIGRRVLEITNGE